MKTICIAEDYTRTPGPRREKQGEFSGERFREEYLDPYFKDEDATIIFVDLDGTYGYPQAFLEEAFGGLARKYGSERVLARLRFKSEEEPYLVDEIKGFMSKESEE